MKHSLKLLCLVPALPVLAGLQGTALAQVNGVMQEARTPLPKFDLVVPASLRVLLPEDLELVVKFRDDLRMRSDEEGRLTPTGASSSESIPAWVAAEGLRFAPLLHTDPSTLNALERRAAERSGRAQPDLAGMLKLVAPGASYQQLRDWGQRLQDLDMVEFAEVEQRRVPPPSDLPPTTPDLTTWQGYRDGNPGVGFEQAYLRGATGAGIRLADCEYGWDANHEDLVDQGIVNEPGQTIPGWVASQGWDDHGTAALGLTAAGRNGYGCDGAAPLASFATFPENSVEQGSRRATCIANAIASSQAGDVVLLEMQTTGSGGGYGPAELNQSVWTVVRTGSDAGIVVVAAAGNGSQDLDSSSYTAYRSRGDSGSIIVGAGSASLAHSPMSFSTYGERVDVQGWGSSVFTLGYGGFAQYGGDSHQAYTSTFSGTSSGSAMVAGVVTALQSYVLAQTGGVLDSVTMRDVLIQTGIPQSNPITEIGPLPDLNAAMDLYEGSLGTNYCLGATNLAGTNGSMGASGSTSLAANDLVLEAFDCTPNNFGIFLFGPSQDFQFRGNGVLCVGGAWRLSTVATDPVGHASLLLDSTPDPGNPYTITAGSVWNFQLWYRDGLGYNFTDGLEVSFQP